jgi:hypothetical protein
MKLHIPVISTVLIRKKIVAFHAMYQKNMRQFKSDYDSSRVKNFKKSWRKTVFDIASCKCHGECLCIDDKKMPTNI